LAQENVVVWHRAAGCEGGACVEVAAWRGDVMVRNSTNPAASSVTVSRVRWGAFLSALKHHHTKD